MQIRKKKLVCPACGFGRLMDADEKTESELCVESEIKAGWKPDYFAKCKRCGKQIGIKKVG